MRRRQLGKGHHGGVVTHVGSSFTTTVEKVDVAKVEVPINKLVCIVLDVSGSMAGQGGPC